MVLAYLRIPRSYTSVLRALGTTAEGTPFHRLDRLRTKSIRIQRGEGTLPHLMMYLASGLPVITDVYTAELPYWQNRIDIPEAEKVTAHAMVVVGIEEQMLYVHDPDFEQGPQAVTLGDFELAWQMRDYRFAVISLSS
jgi:hypothetical protein